MYARPWPPKIWPLARLCLWFWLLVTTLPGHAALGYIPVYDSGFVGQWGINNWPPVAVTDPNAQAPGRSGKAIEVRFSGQGNLWKAFGIGPADWNNPPVYYLNEVRTIEFDVYIAADSVKTENLQFIFEDGGYADMHRLVDFIPGWADMTADQRFGHWFHIRVNLAQLHPKIFRFSRFVLWNIDDGTGIVSEPHFYVAAVKLGWTPDTTPPVIKPGSATLSPTYDQLALVFKTNEATLYRLEYGVNDYSHKVQDLQNWGTAHKVNLTGLTPGTTVRYRFTALDHHIDPQATPNQGVLEGNYVLPPAPTTPPTLSTPTATGVEGHKITLKWTTDRPCTAELSFQKQGGAETLRRTLTDFATARSLLIDLLEPSTAYTGTLKVTDHFGNQASSAVAFTTKAGSSVDVGVTLNPANRKPISPYIYGSNQNHGAPQYTFGRLGGNRWTAYNWENNASNAGVDYLNENDDYLPWVEGVPANQYNVPGRAVSYEVDKVFAATGHAEAVLVTVPILGYVAADKGPGGDVADSGPNYLQTRFKQVDLEKNAPFTTMPDTADPFVFTDEYINWIKTVVKPAHPGKQVFYSLDNEPDIWFASHPRIEPHQESYDSLCQKNQAAAETIKTVDPNAMVFGFVSYGWYGFTYLQGAPDGGGSDHASKGDFTEYYLDRMRQAETTAGKRLVDVLDLHFYTEAKSAGGSPVGYYWDGSQMATLNTPEVVAARLQATRSLWDAGYVENSWIPGVLPDGDKAIRLIPRMKAKIDAHYPGTKFAITEYNYGGGNHISGALAEADALGIFGQQGVFAATRWQMGGTEPFIEAAFLMYRSFDGKAANFGDIALDAQSADVTKVSVYASVDSSVAGRSVFVAINRSDKAQDVGLQGLPNQGTARVYRLAGTATTPVYMGSVPVTKTQLVVALPPMSVSTLEIR